MYIRKKKKEADRTQKVSEVMDKILSSEPKKHKHPITSQLPTNRPKPVGLYHHTTDTHPSLLLPTTFMIVNRKENSYNATGYLPGLNLELNHFRSIPFPQPTPLSIPFFTRYSGRPSS